MKRRTFFTSLAAWAAGLSFGVPLLRALSRKNAPAENHRDRIVVRINPLAVPRAKNDGALHG